MKELWYSVVYEPLYNGLFFFISVVPGADVGLAVIALTLTVKFILFPVANKSIKTQAKVKQLEPEVQKLKEKYKDDKQLQARKVMELYSKNNASPFAGCLPILIQIPIILGLYWVFWKGLFVDPDILYGFVPVPESLNPEFLGMIDMTGKSMLLAVLAGIAQYFQIKLSMPDIPKKKEGKDSMKEEFTRNMGLQMRYVFPVFVVFIAYKVSAAVALYWLVSNMFTIVQELIVRKNAN